MLCYHPNGSTCSVILALGGFLGGRYLALIRIGRVGFASICYSLTACSYEKINLSLFPSLRLPVTVSGGYCLCQNTQFN